MVVNADPWTLSVGDAATRCHLLCTTGGPRRQQDCGARLDFRAWLIHLSTSSARSTTRRPTTHCSQARKEVEQRYDFKGTGASIEWSGEAVLVKANTEERAKAVLDVFQSKLVKRGISLKSLETGDPVAGSKEYRITSTIKDGISQENAKKIGKIIRDEGPKGVKSQIQGDELRVQSKSRDDLQEVQRLLRAADLDVDLQFINYR